MIDLGKQKLCNNGNLSKSTQFGLTRKWNNFLKTRHLEYIQKSYWKWIMQLRLRKTNDLNNKIKFIKNLGNTIKIYFKESTMKQSKNFSSFSEKTNKNFFKNNSAVILFVRGSNEREKRKVRRLKQGRTD